MKKAKILFILEDEDFFKNVQLNLDTIELIELVSGFTLESSQSLLSSSDEFYQGIFINPLSFKNEAIVLLKVCHTNYNSVPIFFLNNNSNNWVESLSKRPLGIQEVVSSVDRVVDIIKKIEKELRTLMPVYEKRDSHREQRDDEKNLKKSNYFPVKIENFFRGRKCFFDVYIKMLNSKMIKVIHQAESFDPKRLNNYMRKGLTHLYIKKAQREYFIKQIQREYEICVASKDIASAVKVSRVLDIGHHVITLLKDTGIKTHTFEYAQKYVENIFTFLKKVETTESVIKDIMQAMPNYDHASGVAFVSALLSSKYAIKSQKGFEALGVAAFLHDVGLYMPNPKTFTGYTKIDFKMDEKDFLEKMNSQSSSKAEQKIFKKIFEDHPLRGREIISEIQHINPLCNQIIYQHHIRVNGEGFPAHKHTVHPLSYVVGISEEFFNAYENAVKKEIHPAVVIENINGFPPGIKKLLNAVFEN